MRVDGPFSSPESLPPDQVGRSGSTSQSNRSTPASAGQDEAQLSVDNDTIQSLRASLAQVPEVRQERVAALRQAVSQGSYQVSDQQLGDAMANDLLGRVIG
jgi:negative regulator of flagellin synthesis FlgM